MAETVPDIRFAELSTHQPTPFEITPSHEQMDRMAQELGLISLRKLRFSGEIRPQGASDWTLNAVLGATVEQACVVTLQPVTTRIDEAVSRSYLAEMPEATPDSETEMPEDDTAEPLPRTLDLTVVLREALALALPLYPRAPDAALETASFTEPGKTPMTDEDARPFAGLKDLRDNLGKDDT